MMKRIWIFALVLCTSSVSRAQSWEATTLPTRGEAAAGVTWYRCFVRVMEDMTSMDEGDLRSNSVTLSLAGLPSHFAVYINDKKIGEGDSLPDEPRKRFKVPRGTFKPKVFNVLAIQTSGPIRKPPIVAGYFDELIFEGNWEASRAKDIDPKTFAPVQERPKTASFDDTQFRKSSTPLSANMELMPGKKLPPEQSFKTLKPADDLAIDLMLAEPTVAQPTHISFDERGRMWVAQYRQYPYPAGLKMISRDMYYRSRFDKIPPPPPHHDRGRDIISVHEDTDHDGKFDKNTVVLEGLNMCNASLRGHGGIWIMQTPYLLFYPDANGDDIPDRDPEVRLAGFGLEDTHSVANGLVWGMDGWLYGVQGSTTTSRVTRPDVDPPNAPGVYEQSCMCWRYHPEKKIYEVFAGGGGNNFGLDVDDEGRIFTGHNGGVTHGWHFIQEGVFRRQDVEPSKYGPPPNPYSFGELPQMLSSNAIPRFTHQVMIYGGNALPKQYLGTLIGADPLNHDVIAADRKTRGSTFQTSDKNHLFEAGDKSVRPVFVVGGPDGAVYVADFYEEFIAHGQNYQGQIDPNTGRIYRVRGKDATLNTDINLAAKTTAQLIETLSHPNKWHRQTAVRLLGERKDSQAIEPLKKLLHDAELHPAVEALWALHQMGALDEATAISALSHKAGPVRAWAIRVMGDAKQLSPTFERAVLALAASDSDPEVLCQVSSTARRLPADESLPLVTALLKRDAVTDDPYTPLMCWWAIEPFCDTHLDAVLALFKDPAAWDAAAIKKHILSRLMRRLATKATNADFLACATLLNAAPSDGHRKKLMEGFEEAYKGRALPALPQELVSALAKSGLASPVLRVRLGDRDAIANALKVVQERTAKPEELLTTITLLGEVEVPGAVPALLATATQDSRPQLRKAALTALLRYDDPTIVERVATIYKDLPGDVRPAAQNLLASQPGGTVALLKLIEEGTSKPADVPLDVITRLKTSEDTAVAERAAKIFPGAAPSDREKRLGEVQRIKRVVEGIPGDPYKGEEIFLQRCSTCHTLFFKGGNIGPNLSNYQRADLGTMLPSIVDPSGEIREGFQTYVVRTKAKKVFSGFMVENDAAVVVLRGTDGQDVRVARQDVKDMKPLGMSLMPEGLLNDLSDQQLRDFFAYMAIPQPITR
jgi:putative heme-binding domain-containing protein